MVDLADGTGPIYNQAAFRYFQALEMRRASRSARRLLLVLVRIRGGNPPGAKLPPHTAAAVFSALRACVREVDFVGWRRNGTVAAALLTLNSSATDTAGHVVCTRVVRRLEQRLPPDDLDRLLVRAIELGPPRNPRINPRIKR